MAFVNSKPLKSILLQYSTVLVIAIPILLYINTLFHKYTQDDAIAIYQNEYVKQGTKGIPDIFTTGSFQGFFGSNKSNLVSGGRYRPLTMVYFAVMWEIFGDNPLIGHASNILMYSLLCFLLYQFLQQLRPKDKLWAILVTLIYIIHPIHTEAVANIKGLDEIWSLTFGILAATSGLKYIDNKSFKNIILSCVFFFFALLSKENSIAFLGIVPITIWFFRDIKAKQFFIVSGALLLTTAIYMTLRYSVVGFSLGNTPLEMMNNPFMKNVDGAYYAFTSGEKWASIIYGLGKYVQLLFFPHPLTHDYYPRHFAVMTLSNPAVILAAIMNFAILFYALIDLKRKSIVSYAAIFYLATIVLTSNIIFPIGTHLSERFLFTPSLSYALIIGTFFTYLLNSQYRKLGLGILIVLITLMSAKTITRNITWQSDFKLFTTDVKTSKNSAKVQNAAGGAKLTEANEIKDPTRQKQLRTEAKTHLQTAISIHPKYKNAHLLLGNAHFGLEEYDTAIRSYEKALEIDPYYKIAEDNLTLSYREGARYEGSKNNNIDKAIQYLIKADVLSPRDYETISLLGIAYGNKGDLQRTLEFFAKALKIQPNNARANLNLSNAYFNLGDKDNGNIFAQKARELNPNIK